MNRFSLTAAAFALIPALFFAGCQNIDITGLENRKGKSGEVYRLAAKLDPLLKEYVNRGAVNYDGLCKDDRLGEVVSAYEKSDPDLSSRKDGLAYWINVYNLFTLNVICKGYPVESINDLHSAGGLFVSSALGQTVWKVYRFNVAGRELTLDAVEHSILRPSYDDFRIHAAINCASIGCPPLRSEAYYPERIDEQLTDQMKVFLAKHPTNRIDTKSNTVSLSKVFKWFKEDFKTKDGKQNTLEAIRPYVPESWKKAGYESFKVQYSYYDWSLNSKELY